MKVPATILKIHGIFIASLGFTLFIGTLVGRMNGIGMFWFLQVNIVAAIGFHEAYFLVGLLGLACFIGSRSKNLLHWQCLIISLHIFLMVVNLLHWSYYSQLKMIEAGYLSTNMHLLFALIEIGMILKDKKFRRLKGEI
ncbi:hypothetical protein [Leptospira limi]|uniref:DUF4345 domain-containing protein n=1 Tax=Leptospira limi TaxID=2950023 RepID=A0ABT3M1D4_9LEPT|nr:hypothetical protein [Leptospira limi]MCW7463428.1 hypothetical protein [Leptospira limi]